MALQRVDKLVVTFLVDNTIEWFTKLPPGFSHELPQNLRGAPVDESTKVPTMDFNTFCCGAHGFSALIRTELADTSHLSLFDTGPDSSSLIRNISAMRVPVEKIERVIVSHWHSDHTGGLLSFLKGRTAPCIVDVHPDRPIARGIAPGPKYDTVACMLAYDPTAEQIQQLGGIVETHSQGHAVAGNTVWVSGEIPRVTPYESGVLGGMRFFPDETSGQGKWIAEQHIMDERYALVDVVGKGLVIFSAHAGIVNVVKDAVSRFHRPVYMIIGGLHLSPPDMAPAIEPTIKFLAEMRPTPTYILPMHCSGFQCKVALEKEFGEGCVPAGVGMRVEVVGNRTDDERVLTT